MFDTVIRQGNVVFHDHCRVADIGVKDGKIVCIADQIDAGTANVIDAAGQYVLPGMVDVHMHISEPGRTEWEGYLTGTQAMAAGGTTSFVEMPLNTMPATIDIESLNVKLAAAKDQCYVDYSPMAGLVPWNRKDLKALSEANVAAYKCFVATCGSGKPGDFKHVDDYELYTGMLELAKTGDLLVIHCENAAITDKLGEAAKAAGKTKVSDYVATRPVFTEVEAVRRVLFLAKETGCPVHIAHCSCPEAIAEVEQAIAEGVNASFESCPHYLLLATEELDEIGPRAKCSPPIRNRDNQRRMWDLMAAGKIQMLGSDHSPCTPDLKASSNAFDAWGGLSACQNSVDAMFDAAVKQRGICPSILMRALATEPARRFRLNDKGEIALGKDADIVLLDPNQSYTLKADDLYYKNRFSVYEGRHIGCRITHTLVRGNLVYSQTLGIIGAPQGQRMKVYK